MKITKKRAAIAVGVVVAAFVALSVAGALMDNGQSDGVFTADNGSTMTDSEMRAHIDYLIDSHVPDGKAYCHAIVRLSPADARNFIEREGSTLTAPPTTPRDADQAEAQRAFVKIFQQECASR